MEWVKREWEAVKKSGTMLWGWLQVALGAVAAVMIDLYNDPNVNEAVRAALDPKYLPYYVIVLGILARTIRKHNAPDL